MASASSTKLEIGRYLIDTAPSKSLGRGNYGVLVCPGKHLFTEEKVAAKRYEVFKEYPERMLREIRQEAELMKNIPHDPNTIKILDFLQTDGISDDGEEVFHLWLILEYCPLGDLRKFAKATPLSFSGKVDLMMQSAKGVQHLHQHGFVHRDLKPPNLLVAGTDEAPQIKIADFGESKFVAGTLCTPKGTTPFKAPELMGNAKMRYDNSVDSFALGATFFAYLDYEKTKSMIPLVEGEFIGQYLTDNPDADLAALIINEDDSTEEAELKRLLAAMMGFDPSTRPSIQEVIHTLSNISTCPTSKGMQSVRTKRKTHKRSSKATVNEPMISVQIKENTGHSFHISISRTATIADLMSAIEKATHLRTDRQRIIYAGKQLEDGRTLTDYNIQHGTTLHLIIRRTHESSSKGHVNKPMISVYVKSLTDETHHISISRTATIEDLKSAIEKATQGPTDQQRIIYAGRCLDDGRTLADYNIQDETTLHLVFKLRGS